MGSDRLTPDIILLTIKDYLFYFLLQPSGIEKIASRKGKVYGDEHDGHRLTKEQLDELNASYPF